MFSVMWWDSGVMVLDTDLPYTWTTEKVRARMTHLLLTHWSAELHLLDQTVAFCSGVVTLHIFRRHRSRSIYFHACCKTAGYPLMVNHFPRWSFCLPFLTRCSLWNVDLWAQDATGFVFSLKGIFTESIPSLQRINIDISGIGCCSQY